MLNKIENKIMHIIFEKCEQGKTSVLMCSEDFDIIREDYDLSEKQLEIALQNIMLDNYIELVIGDDNQKKMYVINLKQKGSNFVREKQAQRKRTYMIIARTIGLATLTFIVTMILRAVFG